MPELCRGGANSNHQALYVREAEREIWCTQKRRQCAHGGQRLEPCGHESRNACSGQEVEEAESRFSLRDSTINVALQILCFWLSETDFELWISRTVKEYIFAVLRFQVCGNLVW